MFVAQHALSMLRRRGHFLLFIAAASAIGHELLLARATRFAADRPLVSLLTISAAIVVTVLGYTWMFIVLRPQTQARNQIAQGEIDVRELQIRDDGLLAATFAIVLPFLVFYGAWGLFEQDVSDLVARAVVSEQFDNPLDQSMSTLGLVAAAAYGLRVLLSQLRRRWRLRWLGLPEAACEATWLIMAFTIVRERLPQIQEWVTERRVYVAVADWINGVAHWLEQVSGLLGRLATSVAELLTSVSRFVEPIKLGIVEPALWLAIAAIAMGCELDRRWHVLRVLPERATPRLTARMPRPIRVPVQLAAQELHEKYGPLANGARIVFAAGGIPLLICAAWYGAARLAELETQRMLLSGLSQLEPPDRSWLLANAAMSTTSVVFTAIQVAILVAGVELMLLRVIERIRDQRATTLPSTPPVEAQAPGLPAR